MSLQGLTGSLSEELDTHQINVNIVCPGIIDTSRWDNTNSRREEWERLETNTPMRMTGIGNDIASTIVLLCSNQVHWITGQPINIDLNKVAALWLTACEETFRQSIHAGSMYSTKPPRERMRSTSS